MVYDLDLRVMVLFGGDESGGSGTGLDDTWLLDAGVWTQLQTTSVPPPRFGHAMAYDRDRKKVIMFGGQQGGTHRRGYADTHALYGGNWQRQNSMGGGPSARYDLAMAWDPGLRAVILFGGWDPNTNQALNDTWWWDDAQGVWVQLMPATTVPPRMGHRMVTDESTGSILMFGGRTDPYATTEFDETWRWQNGDWQLLTPVSAPPVQSNHAMAYDSNRGTVVLFGAGRETWEWDGTGWRQPSLQGDRPQVDVGHSMAFDRRQGRVVLFGGGRGTTGVKRGTWTYDGTRWTEITNTPPVRVFPAMAYDRHRGRTVVFSGAFLIPATVLADTWEWNGQAWENKTPGVSPPGERYFNQMVYRTAGRHCFLWARDSGWTWDGSRWTRVGSPGNVPSPRDLTALAYDEHRDRVVLFGGVDPQNSRRFYGDTWEWDGSSWTRVAAPVAPPPRVQHSMAYDPVRRRVVLYGGATDTSNPYPGETWEYDGTTWVQLQPGTAPTVSIGAAMCYHGDRGKVVLYGGGPGLVVAGQPGYIGGISSEETWEWDGTTWTRIQRFLPYPRENAGIAYDSGRQRAIMIGGAEATPVSYVLKDPSLWSYFSERLSYSPSVVRIGQAIDLTLHLEEGRPGTRMYEVGFSSSRFPSIPLIDDPLFGAIELPLKPDILFQVTLGGIRGVVPNGPVTVAGLLVPNDVILVGQTIYSAAVSFDMTGVKEITNEVILTIN